MAWIVLLGAFLLGSIPGAVLVGRSRGVQVTREGSTNPGTANILRLLGRGPALICLLIDLGKGIIAVVLGGLLGFSLLAAAGVIAGHNWSVFLKGKGGKGIATMAGTLLVLSPLIIPVLIITFLAINFLTSYIALSSVITGFFLPLLLGWQLGISGACLGFAIAIMLLLKHWKNLNLTFKGKEEKKNLIKAIIPKGGEFDERKN